MVVVVALVVVLMVVLVIVVVDGSKSRYRASLFERRDPHGVSLVCIATANKETLPLTPLTANYNHHRRYHHLPLEIITATTTAITSATIPPTSDTT